MRPDTKHTIRFDYYGKPYRAVVFHDTWREKVAKQTRSELRRIIGEADRCPGGTWDSSGVEKVREAKEEGL